MEVRKMMSRIHPVFAAAGIALIVVSLAGIASLAGLLPRSHSVPDIDITTARAKHARIDMPGRTERRAQGLPSAAHQ
jgi:hypothetical protein